MSLLPSERAQYSAIIDKILDTGDLNTISAKAIRKGLAAKLGIDLTDKKEAIQALILERFDHAQEQAADPDPLPTIEAAPSSNGVKHEHKVKKESKVKSETPSTSISASVSTPGTATPSEDDDSDAPPKKKARKNNKEMDDAKFAALLQAQENSRGRATRGGGVTKKSKVVKKKTPKKKSATKVKADDDSDIELGSDGQVKEKPKKGGFHKQYHLSEPLAELVGEATLSRPQVVKKIWEHIKANDLQDPSDKRQIRCDERMERVFKQDKVHMFTMNKLLGKQLYDVEETI